MSISWTLRLVLSALLMLMAGVAGAQGSTIIFELFDDAQGLPNNQTIGVFQDRDGILWLSSFDGLASYDGYSFTVHRYSNSDTTSLSGNAISAVYEDTDGRLWVGTPTTGVNVSDPEKRGFSLVDEVNGEIVVRSAGIHDITQDSEGRIWLAGDLGLEIITETQEGFKPVQMTAFLADTSVRQFIHNAPVSLLNDGMGRVWIGTNGGIGFYDEEKDMLIYPGNSANMPDFPVDDIEKANDKKVWISCKNEETRLFYYDDQDNNFIPFKGIPFESNTRRAHFTFDFDNRLWIAVFGEQLYGYDFRDSTLFLQSTVNSNIRTERFLRRPFCDNSGMIWVPGAGYFRHRYSMGFQSYYHPFEFHQWSTCIYDDEDVLWTAYREAGLVRLDKRTGETVHYSQEAEGAYRLPTNHLQDIIKTRDGNFVIAGFGWIIVIDGRDGRIRKFNTAGTTRDVFQDTRGRLWAGGYEGLIEFDEYHGVKAVYSLPPLHGDDRNFIQAIAEDSSGIIWFGSGGKGLARLDPETGKVDQFLPVKGDHQSLPSTKVMDMAVDKRNIIWLAMDVGLVRLDPSTMDFKVYDRTRGLENDYIASVVYTPNDNIWISTHSGIAKFDPNTETFRHYGSEYGLLNRIYYHRNKFCTDDGYVYFGGGGGVDYFHPDELREHPGMPDLVLKRLVIDGDPVDITSGESSGIDLTYKQDLIEIELAGLFYSNPSKVTYEYRVDGIHDNWIGNNNQQRVFLSNLAPGEYIFHARAVSPYGIRSEKEIALPLNVSPPFWSTWWFRALLTVAAIGTIWLFIRYREKQIQRRADEQRRLEVRIQELEKKALLAQMNPHFIFNSMNSIQQFMAVKDFEGAMRYLIKFSRLLRFVLNVSSEPRIALVDELTLIQDYIELEKMRFPDRFNYTISVDSDIDLHSLEIPPFFIQPQVENAIRHGLMNKEGEGHLRIDIRKQNGELRVLVEDDGIGREAARKLAASKEVYNKSMGLALVEERLKHLHTDYSKHKLVITDLIDHHSQPAGTRVEFWLPIE